MLALLSTAVYVIKANETRADSAESQVNTAT